MTVTETAEATTTEVAVDVSEPSGLERLLTSTEHTSIGRTWVVLALVHALIVAVLGILTALERSDADEASILGDSAGSLFALQSFGLVLLVVVPLGIGLATYLVPLQVGSSTIAFPRLAAASLWGWVLGGDIFILAHIFDGGPGGGSAEAGELWSLSLLLVAASLAAACVPIVTTAFAYRAEGMSLSDAPFLTWGSVVAGVVWMLALAALVANMIIGFASTTYQSGASGSFYAWLDARWVVSAPMVFGFSVLALAAVADVVSVAAGVPMRRRGIMSGAIVGVGVLGFGAWAQTTRASVNSETIREIFLADDPLFVVMAFAIGLPVLAILGGIGDTFAQGKFKLNGAVALSVVGVLLIGLGVLVGIAHAIEPLDLGGTSIQTGQATMVLFGALAASLGALQHWAPKLFGRSLAEPLAVLAGLALLGGGVAVGLADVIGGLDEMAAPASVADFVAGDLLSGTGSDAASAVGIISLIGWALALGALLLTVLNLFVSVVAGRGADAPDNPWGGFTLEWATTSPPMPGNFVEAPVVNGPYPLVSEQEGDA